MRLLFGVGIARVTRVIYPRSYLILAPGQLTGWWPRLAEPDGRIHYAGAETSVLPSFMEGAVIAGERAARRGARCRLTTRPAAVILAAGAGSRLGRSQAAGADRRPAR